VDARQPHPLQSTTPATGIASFRVRAPARADAPCFFACESGSGGEAHAIVNVVEDPPGEYLLELDRPLGAGTAVEVTYRGTNDVGRFTFHPGNVNGDEVVNHQDVLNLMQCLGVEQPRMGCPWGMPYSLDMDQDGVAGPRDVLRAIDLLNGAEAFRPWDQDPRPEGTCP
jgi:hypothetical protein